MSEYGWNELYRHWNVDDQLLYVGISGTSLKRFVQHNSTSEWASQVVKITIERFPTRLEAQIAEVEAILAEKPLHNVLHPRTESMLKSLRSRLQSAKGPVETIGDLNRLAPDGENRREVDGYYRPGKPTCG